MSFFAFEQNLYVEGGLKMKECTNQNLCQQRAAKWKENQKKYAPIGQQEKDEFLRNFGFEKIRISNHVDNNNHFDHYKRSLYRAVGMSAIREVVIDGEVIERSILKDGRIILNVHYCIKVGKGMYRPLNVILEYFKSDIPYMKIITIYSPNEAPWKWDENMNRICFC